MDCSRCHFSNSAGAMECEMCSASLLAVSSHMPTDSSTTTSESVSSMAMSSLDINTINDGTKKPQRHDGECPKCSHLSAQGATECEMCSTSLLQMDETSNSSTTSSSSSSSSSSITDKSSYYFFGTTDPKEAERYKPKKIEKPVEDEQKSTSTDPSGADEKPKASAWNAAGTWEDVDISNWARDRIHQIFSSDAELIDGEKVQCRSRGADDVSGDSSVVLIRGKRKLGFDLAFSVKFTATVNNDDGENVTIVGRAKIDSLDDSGFSQNECDMAIEFDDDDYVGSAGAASITPEQRSMAISNVRKQLHAGLWKKFKQFVSEAAAEHT